MKWYVHLVRAGVLLAVFAIIDFLCLVRSNTFIFNDMLLIPFIYFLSILIYCWHISPIVDHGKLEAKRVCDHHRSEQEKKKHCQRHDRHEGWIHLAKVTSWSHITSSNINLDQISSSESQPSINFKISIKTSASWLNFKFEILTKPSFRIST